MARPTDNSKSTIAWLLPECSVAYGIPCSFHTHSPFVLTRVPFLDVCVDRANQLSTGLEGGERGVVEREQRPVGELAGKCDRSASSHIGLTR